VALLKAVFLGGVITVGLFLLIIWIIPIMTFLIIFGGITLIIYAIIKDEKEKKRPP